MLFSKIQLFMQARSFSKYLFALLLGAICILWQPFINAAEVPIVIAPPALDAPKVAAGKLQTAVIAGGCFWGVQGVFEHVKGVRKVLSGYSGGDKSTADYEKVSTGTTGHAESVQITFDPAEVSYGKLLQIYFSVAHDPTKLNRQGPDTGTQYRSAIFYTDDTQKSIAQSYIQQLNKSHAFSHEIVTHVDPFKAFYPAEDYHQDFLVRNPTHLYILVNDLPKVENLKHVFPSNYRVQPVTVNGSIAS
jgi:peptide-methionine (S)-S-oxide reductase